MKHEGALAIHANEQLLFQLNADGSIIVGDRYAQDDNAMLVLRTLALKYPRWAGDMVAAYVRALPLDRTFRAAIAGAVGRPVESNLATAIARAVLETIALIAEEQGDAGERLEAARQAQQDAQARQAVTAEAVAETPAYSNANGAAEPPAAAS